MRFSAFHKLGLAVTAIVVAAMATVAPAAESTMNTATPAAASTEVSSTLPKSPASIVKLPTPEEAPLSVGGISIPEPASVALMLVGSAAILFGRRPRESKKT